MKPRLILVHGAFCGGWAFDAFAERLERRGWSCLAPDLPGHGPEGGAAGLSMSDYAREIARLAAAEPVPPVLLGHSLGGLVAQMAAAATEAAGLAVLAPSAPWGIAGQTFEEAASAFGLYALGPFWAQAVDPNRDLARAYSLDRMSPERAREAFARMVPESGRALFEVLNWWLDPFMTTRVDAARIRCPVFAAAGAEDRIHPVATVRQTAARLGAEVRAFEGMSHWLIGEPGFEAVADACLEWLAATVATAPAV